MTTTLNASATNGFQANADGSGVLKVQSNGVTTNALAWVSIAGGATPTIRSAYNVTSVTRASTGVYTVNFTTPQVDANYSAIVSGSGNTSTASASFGVNNGAAGASVAPTTSSFTISCQINGAYADPAYVNIAVFGN